MLLLLPFYTYSQGSFKLIKVPQDISKKNHSSDSYKLLIKNNDRLLLQLDVNNEFQYLTGKTKHTFPRNHEMMDSIKINREDTIQITKPLDTIFATQGKFLEIFGDFNTKCVTMLTKVDTSNFFDVSGDDLALHGIYNDLEPTFSTTKFTNNNVKRLSINSLHFSSLKLLYSYFQKIDFHLVSISNTLVIKDTKIDSAILHNVFLPDTVKLINLDLTDIKGYIDFTNLPYNREKNYVLILGNVDIEKLNIPYDRFTVLVDDSISYEQQSMLYQTVLNKLKERGLNEKFETLDKRYQALKMNTNGHWLINFIECIWWDYGYDKGRIIKISFIFFLAFLILNLCIFRQLTIAYLPENIENYYTYTIRKIFVVGTKRQQFLVYLYKVGIYTGFIFWGLKLDLKDLKLTLWWALLIIIFEYSVGIICLAYIANYIITK